MRCRLPVFLQLEMPDAHVIEDLAALVWSPLIVAAFKRVLPLYQGAPKISHRAQDISDIIERIDRFYLVVQLIDFQCGCKRSERILKISPEELGDAQIRFHQREQLAVCLCGGKFLLAQDQLDGLLEIAFGNL